MHACKLCEPLVLGDDLVCGYQQRMLPAYLAQHATAS
jgi:hypothetical protein